MICDWKFIDQLQTEDLFSKEAFLKWLSMGEMIVNGWIDPNIFVFWRKNIKFTPYPHEIFQDHMDRPITMIQIAMRLDWLLSPKEKWRALSVAKL